MRGSISKHTARDGTVSWHVRVDTVDPATGKRRQPQRTFRTKREAEAGLQEWLAEIAAGAGVTRSSQTLGAYVAWWLDGCVAPRVKPSTLASYRYVCGAYIVPELGGVALQQLSAQRLQGFYARCLVPGAVAHTADALSARTVRYLHSILHQALADALRLGLVARNVADAVRAPRPALHEAAAWTPEEVRRFLGPARQEPLWPLWLVALHTGLRQAELLGLCWRDVDLDGAQLVAREAKRGGHTLRLDAACVDALRTWRPLQVERRLLLGPHWRGAAGLDLVFVGPQGQRLHPTTVRRHMAALVQAAGVSALTFHGLRHTHATLLMLAGVHPKVVSERLGHADVDITMRLYSHVMPQLHVQAAEAFAALVAEPPPPPSEAEHG